MKPGRKFQTGTTGVQIDSVAGCYRAVVCVDGKQHYLGRYATMDEALRQLRMFNEALGLGLTLDEYLEDEA